MTRDVLSGPLATVAAIVAAAAVTAGVLLLMGVANDDSSSDKIQAAADEAFLEILGSDGLVCPEDLSEQLEPELNVDYDGYETFTTQVWIFETTFGTDRDSSYFEDLTPQDGRALGVEVAERVTAFCEQQD